MFGALAQMVSTGGCLLRVADHPTAENATRPMVMTTDELVDRIKRFEPPASRATS
jgi:hypothetical protein